MTGRVYFFVQIVIVIKAAQFLEAGAHTLFDFLLALLGVLLVLVFVEGVVRRRYLTATLLFSVPVGIDKVPVELVGVGDVDDDLLGDFEEQPHMSQRLLGRVIVPQIDRLQATVLSSLGTLQLRMVHQVRIPRQNLQLLTTQERHTVF